MTDADDTPNAHVDFALLADSARFLPGPNVRFNVVGAGLWSATVAPNTRATHPQITVVAGIGYTQAGLDSDHEITVMFQHPDDPRVSVGPLTGGTWNPWKQIVHPVSNPRFEPESIVDVIIVPYKNPLFSDYGRYEFHISIDGHLAKTLYFVLARP